MRKFKLLVLVLIVALGVTACTTEKVPDDKDPVIEENPDQEVDPNMEVDPEIEEPETGKDPAVDVGATNVEANKFLKDFYDNRARKVSYDGVTDLGDMKIESKYYIDGENYRIESNDMVSIYNADKKEVYTYDTETMEGTIQTEENIPAAITEFQEVQGLKLAELRDFEGKEAIYVESIAELEGKEIIAKSWLSKKYYINLKGEATEDGKVVSNISSSNITEDFDSKVMFQEPEGVDFKEAR